MPRARRANFTAAEKVAAVLGGERQSAHGVGARRNPGSIAVKEGMSKRVCILVVCVVAALVPNAAVSGTDEGELGAMVQACLLREPDETVDSDLAIALSGARARVEMEPRSPWAWTRLGMIYDVHRRFRSAVGCYARALQLAPQEPRIAYLLAAASLQAELPEASTNSAVHRALRLAPRYGPLRVRWAEYLLGSGRQAEARAAFAEGIAVMPIEQSARARRGLGLSLLAEGNIRGGVGALQGVLAIRADDGPTWEGLARGYHLLGMDGPARAAMDRGKGMSDHLGYFDVWRLPVLEEAVTPPLVEERIMAKLGMGRRDDALADALRWERQHPDWPSIKRFVGNLYRDLGREDMTQQYFDAATRSMQERHVR